MFFDEIDDRDLADIIKRNVRIEEFDRTLENVGPVTIKTSNIKRELAEVIRKARLNNRNQDL
jgi:hypothetical protein